jgi:hypothetical protein
LAIDTMVAHIDARTVVPRYDRESIQPWTSATAEIGSGVLLAFAAGLRVAVGVAVPVATELAIEDAAL